jgi:hypothetical protein
MPLWPYFTHLFSKCGNKPSMLACECNILPFGEVPEGRVGFLRVKA